MSFLVDFDALGDLNIQLCNQSGQFQEALKTFSDSMGELIGSPHMTGKGADNIRDYLSNVHNVITALLGELISTHCSNEMLYFQDYRDTIDSNIHAYIDCAELTKLEEQVQTQKDAALVLDDRLSFALAPIRDIFTVSYRDVTSVDSAHKAAVDYLSTLNENIHALEERHLASDFTNTEKLIQNLRTFIQECRGQSRSYKSSFVPEMLASSASFLALYESHLAIEKEMSEKGPAIEAAIEAENERIAQLQAEYEARKKTAEKQKWLLTGACVLGSIAAIAIIVGSGGTATPLVVGAVSAVSGTVMAGGHALADQYVEHGSLRENAGKYDWGSVFKSAAIGGATGFVTGYLGAGVSQAVTSGLSSTAAGSALLNSTNAFTRIGANVAIGSISQVSSGIVTRGTGAFLTNGFDFKASVQEAFNLKSIAFDAAMGGGMGGIRGFRDPPVGKELKPEDIDKDLLATKPKNSPVPEKWMENGGKIYVDGNGTWTYEAPDGVHVCYSDGYPDFDRAGLVEKKVDIGEFSDSRTNDFSQANKVSPKSPTTTWHHNQDGHTLEAVDTFYHKLFTHRGGFSITNHGG